LATPNTTFLSLRQLTRPTEATTTFVRDWIDGLSDPIIGNMAKIDAGWRNHDLKITDIENSISGIVVNNPTITITQGGEYKGSFTLNQSDNKTIDLAAGLPIPTVDPVFDNNSWADIAFVSETFIVQNGLTPGDLSNVLGWNLGDMKSFTDGDITYQLRIIGVNHDRLVGGTRAGLTLELTAGWGGSTDDRARMNATNTNLGGWDGSRMRIGTDAGITTIPNIRSQLPADLLAVLKTVNKSTATDGLNPTLINSQDDLFLFSEVEVTGGSASTAPGEGVRYAFYTVNNTNAARIKQQPAGTNSFWWLRSPVISPTLTDTAFVAVSMVGSISPIIASAELGVSFGLCI